MLKIKKDVYDRILETARSGLPNETCGYLAGKDNLITLCYPLTNMDHSPDHYSFDPEEQFEAMKDARRKGLDIIANFHSHPETPARPSGEDIKLAYDPNIIYGIVSMKSGTEILNFFRIKEKKVTLIEYSIV
ncbi:MAG: M67 family metallopeptidase [Marinilabilia sp.]